MTGTPAFFPALRPGELLYSVLARHTRWSAGRPKATMNDLFGNAGTVASIDLPNRLDALAAHLPPWLSVDALIDRHTLAPYYWAFLPAEVRRSIRAGMKGNGGSLHLSSGLAAFRVGRVTRLRFCPNCVQDMHAQWGSPHWRRDHQLPSVLLCPEHGTFLRESTVDVGTFNRHEFVAATDATCPPLAKAVTNGVNSADSDTLLRLARSSAALLDEVEDGRTDFAELSKLYRNELRSRGLMRSRFKVDQVALQDAFMDRFGSVIGRFRGLVSADQLRGQWLATLARKQRKASHPIEHLLLRDLLCSRAERDEPCGKGPWPCRNPLADHIDEDVVTDLRIYRNRAAEVAVFSCACGFRYTRSLRADGVLGPCRFKDFGPLLRPALVEMINAGTSLRGVAARLRVDPKTVATLALQLELETQWSIRPSARHPNRAVTEGSTPTSAPAKRRKAPARCDWRRSDLELAARVAGAAMRLRSVSPPARVTAAAVERELLGRRGWIAKRSSKLPRTVAAIAETAETLTSFQSRRIDFAIATVVVEDRPLRAWAIMRKAGLRSDKLGLIEKRIEVLSQICFEIRLSG